MSASKPTWLEETLPLNLDNVTKFQRQWRDGVLNIHRSEDFAISSKERLDSPESADLTSWDNVRNAHHSRPRDVL